MHEILAEIVMVGILTMGGGGEEISSYEVNSNQEHLVRADQPVYRRFRTNLARRHDRGFMFRAEIGAVGVTPTEFEVGGFTVAGQLAVGGLPWRQVALHASAFGWGTDTKGVLGLGPGVTFWFQEEGPLFLSASAGPTTILSVDHGGSSQFQLGGEVQLGFYGWVGDRWSLGASLVVGGESFDLDGDGESWNRARGGLRIGVMFN